MHAAEEVRDVAAIAVTGLAYEEIAPMLLAYADLLEAMEEGEAEGDVLAELIQVASQLERELSAARAEADRLREAMRPKIMPSVGVAIGTRLRDFYRNRFALVNPVQHTDNERQVILAALESLLSALAATRKEDSNG